MPFTPPSNEELKGFSVAGIQDLHKVASTEITEIKASVTPETVTVEQLDRLEELQAFTASAKAELEDRQAKADRLAKADAVELPAEPETPVTAAAETFDDQGVKDVTASTQSATADVVVDASITAAGANPTSRSVTPSLSEIAPLAPMPQVTNGEEDYTIIAAADLGGEFSSGQTLTWQSIGKAFEERVRSHGGLAKSGKKVFAQHSLATIRRNYSNDRTILEGDGHESAFAKLKSTSDDYARNGVTAANGFCAPSEPDYSICNPITTDGLLNLPEMVLRRGGLLHNQGLDFGDFFGNDFVLPIPGYNILTEAQVIADTAKTCVEIPCPSFVDDRLNVAALCLTGSLLQNRGYPEFVSEFVQGAIAAMAHLVNREVINEIETGSTAVNLSTVDPWGTDGTVWSQLMAVFDFIATDIRTFYRASRTQTVDIVLPQWVQQALRSDWLRRNATHTEDLTDAMINGALSRRNVRVQWVYDWQDAFDPTNGAGAIPATNLMGAATAPFNNPTAVTFLAFLPGTWVLGRQDVIRLDTVYDSTNLQQNLVTQLFMEDGFKPMRMCQLSRAYTVPICASGSTGVQRAVACADVTP